jgi:hypothetical protein
MERETIGNMSMHWTIYMSEMCLVMHGWIQLSLIHSAVFHVRERTARRTCAPVNVLHALAPSWALLTSFSLNPHSLINFCLHRSTRSRLPDNTPRPAERTATRIHTHMPKTHTVQLSHQGYIVGVMRGGSRLVVRRQ